MNPSRADFLPLVRVNINEHHSIHLEGRIPLELRSNFSPIFVQMLSIAPELASSNRQDDDLDPALRAKYQFSPSSALLAPNTHHSIYSGNAQMLYQAPQRVLTSFHEEARRTNPPKSSTRIDYATPLSFLGDEGEGMSVYLLVSVKQRFHFSHPVANAIELAVPIQVPF